LNNKVSYGRISKRNQKSTSTSAYAKVTYVNNQR